MKKIVLLLGAASVMLSLLMPAFAGAAPKDKVPICHKPGTPAEKTLYLPESAIPGHLGHGDKLGKCDRKPDDGKKVVYYNKIVEVKKDGTKKIECTKAPDKSVVPKDSSDKKFYTADTKSGPCDPDKEKKVFVKKDEAKKKYKCIEVNKATAVLEHKKMYKDGPTKKSKGCTEPYKKFHA
jgi:hypothetical protein